MSSFDRRSIILNSINFAATSSLSPRKQPAKMYTNPVWAHDFPDPHFMLHDGKVYAYATETPGFKFQVMESRDLVHWTHKGTAFTGCPKSS